MITDSKLLSIYHLAFVEELDGRYERTYDNIIQQRAYDLGRLDAIVGDECPSNDLQSDDKILRRILQ